MTKHFTNLTKYNIEVYIYACKLHICEHNKMYHKLPKHICNIIAEYHFPLQLPTFRNTLYYIKPFGFYMASEFTLTLPWRNIGPFISFGRKWISSSQWNKND